MSEPQYSSADILLYTYQKDEERMDRHLLELYMNIQINNETTENNSRLDKLFNDSEL